MENANRPSFDNRVQALRMQKGYSLEDLAKKIGVSRVSVLRWENGTTSLDNASNKHVRALADALGTSIAYLKGRTDDPKPEASTDAVIETYASRYLQRVFKERMGSYVVDVLAAASGMNIEYTSEGDILVEHKDGSVYQAKQEELDRCIQAITDYAAFQLGKLGEMTSCKNTTKPDLITSNGLIIEHKR